MPKMQKPQPSAQRIDRVAATLPTDPPSVSAAKPNLQGALSLPISFAMFAATRLVATRLVATLLVAAGPVIAFWSPTDSSPVAAQVDSPQQPNLLAPDNPLGSDNPLASDNDNTSAPSSGIKTVATGVDESSVQATPANTTKKTDQRSRANHGFVSSDLTHPPKQGRAVGGVVVKEEPLPEKISFNFHVRSILSENCFYCHGPDPIHRAADLRLDTKDGYLDVIEPGDPKLSDLIDRITSDDQDTVMPPPESGRALTKRQKQILKKWIEQGASYEKHWAFTKAQRPAVPEVNQKGWPRNEIDQFVLAKLEGRGIEPSPRARPETILRRMHWDLIGLPPTPDQSAEFIKQFETDPDAAIDKLADRLLASPHYGERMALPWLDAARYSDSNGFQADGDRMQWPWRDWVVDAMNDNMPFDQFTIEQLAGDLLPNPTNQQLIATAFNRNHMLNGEGGALPEEQRNNYVFDRVDTTSTTWLGLTMACAQCHDHKYDPITQEDYYRFFAYFNNVDEKGNVDNPINRFHLAKPFLAMPTDEQTEALNQINANIRRVERILRKNDKEITVAFRKWEKVAREKKASENMTRDVFNLLVKLPKERSKSDDARLKSWYLEFIAKGEWHDAQIRLNKLRRENTNTRARIITVMVMRERKKVRPTHILDRGNYEVPTKTVTSGVPHFLPVSAQAETSSRLDLAHWLVSAENPLTSRVQVNRYWQMFFGTGLVKTSEDFGVQGELPSHPKLLDWLAVEFRENGWNVKAMHRMMVTSAAYLQSSKFRAELEDIDPENRLLARSPRLRMSSMLIRDAALAVSGLLNPKVGGAPVYPYQPDRLWKDFSLGKFAYKTSRGDDLYRRGIYTFWRRTVPPPNMFDAANRQTCTVKPSRTNTPLHALTLLNDPTYVEAAGYLASSVMGANEQADDEAIKTSFHRCVGRQPSQTELTSLQAAFEESHDFFDSNFQEAEDYVAVGEMDRRPQSKDALVDLAALTSVVQVIMNTDEFMTRE